MELIRRKCEVIEQTDSLRQVLTNLKVSTSEEIIPLRSDHYVAVGCDLRAVEKLQGALAEEFELGNSLVLCTAEVSVTYIDVQSADALIRWAATLRNGMSSIGYLRRAHALIMSQLDSVFLNNSYPVDLNILLQKR